MLKTAIQVICCFAYGIFTVATGQELKMSDVERSVVQIVVQKPDASMTPFGTGFFIGDNGTIATALHVYSESFSKTTTKRAAADPETTTTA